MTDSPTKTPAGWEPYTEHTETIGKAIVRLPKPGATARDLLIQAGFSPDEWQISGSINTRKWMTTIEGQIEWLYYYKFDVVAGESPELVQEHVDNLAKHIRRRRSHKVKEKRSGNDAFGMMISDWQIGKAEGNDGTPQTIDRVMKTFDMAGDRIKKLRNNGAIMPTLLIAGLGDIGEGTCGFYPGQQFLIDRNRREQGRIIRELLTDGLDYLTPMFDHTEVAVVGGNHGENRGLDGKRITSDGDNDDCAYFEAVMEAYNRAGEDHINWTIMEDELSMKLEVAGVKLGFTHGHLFQKGSTPQQKAYNWWLGQDFHGQAMRDVQILNSAHFHHPSVMTYGNKTHMQTPAMDPGSKWFRETSGQDSSPGTLTYRIDGTTPLGWTDLSILHP